MVRVACLKRIRRGGTGSGSRKLFEPENFKFTARSLGAFSFVSAGCLLRLAVNCPACHCPNDEPIPVVTHSERFWRSRQRFSVRGAALTLASTS